MERVCPMESLNQLFIRLLKFLISNDYFNGIMGESINIRLEVVDAFAWTFASIACLPSNKTDLIFSHNIYPEPLKILVELITFGMVDLE